MRMTETLVAVDVGASHTRVRVGSRGATGGDPSGDVVRSIRSADALFHLLGEVRRGVEGDGPVHLSAGVAGPMVDGGAREITNWSGPRRISPEALRSLGFHTILLMNDLEAAAHGLVALLASPRRETALLSLDGAPVPGEGNRVLVMPGSGLGSAGVVDLGGGRGERWHVVPSEAAHAAAGGQEHDPLLHALTEERRRPPTWEECVSGPGLETLWRLSGEGGDPPPARDIARLAREGEPRARTALDQYYLFAARFSQALSLAFLPLGGLYLSGSSTRANHDLIPRGAFLEAFRANPHMAPLLRQIPVFLVLEEINLLGAWSRGWAQRLPGPSTGSPPSW